LRILIVSYCCPPEVAAPASRVYENSSRFSELGHEVTILTGFPNHPRGKVFPGYRLRLIQRERMGDVNIIRVASLVAPNTSARNRLKSYLSLMLAQMIGCLAAGPADVVIGTSPPLFTALAGYVAALIKRCPFVFEVRDLWPENMIAVKALTNPLVIRVFRALELFLYRRARKIIPVTRGFRDYIADKGISAEHLAVITNGVDLSQYRPTDYPGNLARQLGLEGKFVAAYIGTVGINHGIQILLDAGEILRDCPDVVLLVVGDGAERRALEDQARRRRLTNVRFLGEEPRHRMPEYHALADCLLVLLRKADYFRRVIPSKIFVAMGMARPIVIGVEGESRDIIETAGAGIGVDPENPQAVADGIGQLRRLKRDGRLDEMGQRGRRYVARHFDRDALAQEYHRELLDLASQRGP